MGSGMATKMAQNLGKRPMTIITTAPACATAREPTLVTAIAPMFSPYEVVPLEVPKRPHRIRPHPSLARPRTTAAPDGGGAPASLAHA